MFAAPPTTPAPTMPFDPLGGGMGDAQAAAQTWITAYGVPVVVALVVLGALIKLGLRWLRRGSVALAPLGQDFYDDWAADEDYWDERGL